jgi:hypothetical protein
MANAGNDPGMGGPLMRRRMMTQGAGGGASGDSGPSPGRRGFFGMRQNRQPKTTG